MSLAAETAAPLPRKTGRKPAVANRPEGGTPQQAAAGLQGELRITIVRNYVVHFRGTSQQLLDEGLVPAGFKFPSGWESVKLPNIRDLGEVSLERKRLPRTGNSRALVDSWVVNGWVADRGQLQHSWRVQEAARLLREHQRISSPEWTRAWQRANAARTDQAFQAAMDFRGLIRAAKEAL